MKKLIFLSLIFFIANVQSAFAELHLVLTKGISQAVPIAVVPFNGQSNQGDSSTNIAAIIQNDLTYSGHFKVMATDAIKQFPATSDQVNFNYWQQTENNYLVVGNITPASFGQYQVTFALINIYLGNNKNPNSENPVVISERYTVSANQFRALAHKISDTIYQQLTGIRGIFSTRIAYVLVQRPANQSAQYSLMVADADGYNPQALVTSNEPLMSPAWSPDGQKIAYVSLANQQAAIYVVNVATGYQRLISDFPGINGAPAWSPDQRKLAIVLSKTGSPKIYLYDLESRELQQLTDGVSIDTEPNWAPDGKSIIFTSNRSGGPQIYRYNLANGETERMTFDGNYNATPNFTDAGKKIVVLHQSKQGFNIALQNIASGALTVLTHNGYDSSPSVAPNGQMIIYANDANLQGILEMVSIDGKVKLNLPSPEGTVLEPAWSPFLG